MGLIKFTKMIMDAGFPLHLFDKMDDERYLKIAYWCNTGKKLNLTNPKTYNEKVQWLKLYNRKNIFTTMVDKSTAKDYVSNIVGDECIIPTIGVWDSFDEIDFEKLPDKFVLKCTHDSGGLVICKDKANFDKEAARKKINKCLKVNYFYYSREWPYKNVKPRIIAEEYLDALDSELVEYKMFCFDGEVKMVLVCKGSAHGGGRTNDYCDTELNRLPFTCYYPNSKGNLEKPKELPELIKFAEVLSKDIPLLRVDTYLVNGKIYFGELTFFHNSGYYPIEPDEWDGKIGEWIKLPEKKIVKE